MEDFPTSWHTRILGRACQPTHALQTYGHPLLGAHRICGIFNIVPGQTLHDQGHKYLFSSNKMTQRQAQILAIMQFRIQILQDANEITRTELEITKGGMDVERARKKCLAMQKSQVLASWANFAWDYDTLDSNEYNLLLKDIKTLKRALLSLQMRTCAKIVRRRGGQ